MNSEMFFGDIDSKVMKPIGTGSFGNVFLSRDSDGEDVCVKKIIADTEKACVRIEDEIRIFSSLEHPNIIQFLWSFELAGTVNIVMEYAGTTTTMRDIIDERSDLGCIHPARMMDYFVDVVMGLEYLCRKDIVHRDIKPENLLITNCDTVKIADFGVSIYHQPGKPRFGGTMRYMSPEALNRQMMDFRSDVWSLGCVLHELCTGDHPLGDARNKCEIEEQLHVFFKPYFKVGCFAMKDGDLWTSLCGCMLTYDIENRITIQDILNYDERIKSHKYVQQYYSEE